MTKRDIELAKQAGMTHDKYGMFFAKDYHEDGVDLEKFADLIRSDEREACANVVESTEWSDWFRTDCAAAIRARGNT